MSHTPTTQPTGYVRVHRGAREGRSTVAVGDVAFGGERFVVIAGPCAVESAAQIEAAAALVRRAGGHVLRGGAFKPRTSPYAFEGLGLEGVELIARAARRAGIPFVTEVVGVAAIEAMAPLVDAFQVGARNMHNFELLAALGRTERPVLLKRGFGATLTEWLHAAEHVASRGNERIILCERGIRGVSGGELRFTLDLAGALWARERTHLPVIVDPSHATGAVTLVAPLARAALAAGLDGVMIEVHPEPPNARCDREQALGPEQFEELIEHLVPFGDAAGRRLT